MSKFLEDFSEYLKGLPFHIYTLAEYKDGKIEVMEDIPANPAQNTYSVSKLYTAAAIGMLRDEGKLSVNEKICDILRDEIIYDIPDKRWYDVTVEMLLTHRAGLPGGYLDIDTTDANTFGDDYVKHCLTCKLEYTPGEDEKYSDGAYYLLSVIVEKKSEKTTSEFLWDKLFFPAGFKEVAWASCPKGHSIGATGLYIRSEDMVKLGAIYANDGLYDGKRYLSSDWVHLSLENGYGVDHSEDRKIYFKGGMCGQKLIAVPDCGRAVALQAYGANSDTVAEFVRTYKD